MREAAALLVGTHDFSSFRAINSDMAFKNPVKTLDVAGVQPGCSFTQAHFHRWVLRAGRLWSPAACIYIYSIYEEIKYPLDATFGNLRL